ncbi:MAG TPA: PQQ-dependent dehydrogenase, methanol/ethanol family [Candidatus Methylomirabilis sp.]|nr:PQQ-dependent dehydrogenase, methanol/ethanol family [Candidatus Methylomirabilis sp.]
MPRLHTQRLAVYLAIFAIAGCQSKSQGNRQPQNATPANVDDTRLLQADNDPGNWMTYGRTYSEQRFSPLKQVNDQNVSQLGLAWSFDLDTHRGQEATPIVVDGVMYFSTAWSKVFAVNAATGEKLWSYDPKVPPETGVNACCDVVNRGVAVWRGKVYVATLDGRLVALDAATGKSVWQTQTTDPAYRYTITGAPRVVKGKVLIGNAGAEMGVRGYVSAYDAESGKLVWRFFTVPGDPSKPFESPALAKAAATWSGQWWKLGGGGTVWDSIVYDPETDLVFIGTGNGTPWNRRARSPQGKDNLFTSSIVALNAETGEYAWHYQEVPGDDWDYDSASPMILADISLNGIPRKALFHAPKDGFFYVLDRATGQVISAKPYTPVTWATGVDTNSGRPIENAAARYDVGDKGAPLAPGPMGGHSWHSMSYSPLTGLVYVPVQESSFLYKSEDHFQTHNLAFNVAVDFVAAGMPQNPQIKKTILDSIKGHLSAWDPVQQKEVWRVDRVCPTNGGTLATAGNLVFQGTAQGNLEAFRAGSGQKLWSADTQSGVIAAPISYSVGNDQYIAVVVGWGGVFPLASGEVALKAGRSQNIARVLAFKLGGTAALPPLPQFTPPQLNPPKSTASAATVRQGEALFQNYCSTCHGDVAVGGGVLPDLRYSGTLANSAWPEVVLGGSLKSFGMISFAKELSKQDAEAIRAYVIFRANQSRPASPPPGH